MEHGWGLGRAIGWGFGIDSANDISNILIKYSFFQ
jgi:hypothetical protein